jgi:hypothetical protein
VAESDGGGARVVIENVDFLAGWDEEDTSPTTDTDDDPGWQSPDVDATVDRPDDTSYITGEVTDRRDSAGRVDQADN